MPGVSPTMDSAQSWKPPVVPGRIEIVLRDHLDRCSDGERRLTGSVGDSTHFPFLRVEGLMILPCEFITPMVESLYRSRAFLVAFLVAPAT